jgi:hypothetical protein
MPDPQFKSRAELEEWANRAHFDHETGEPAPDKRPEPGDTVELVLEATSTNRAPGSEYHLVPA